MDTSSDSEEFYECDDDLDEDVPKKLGEGKEKEDTPGVCSKSKPAAEDANPVNQKHPTDNTKEVISSLSNNNLSTQDEKTSKTIHNNNISSPEEIVSVPDVVKSLASEKIVENVKEKFNKPKNCVNKNIKPVESDTSLECLAKIIENKCSVKESSQSTTQIEENTKSLDENDVEVTKVKPVESKNTCIIENTKCLQEETVAEENLWEDEDDWGKLEQTQPTPRNQEPPHQEEDLWGEGDGWGIETPQETPKKLSTPQPNIAQTSIKKEENDLWAEGDNWGIDDAPETKTELKPTKNHEQDAKSALDVLTKKEEPSWGGWSNWGISSVLSTAANITTQVSQGISNVLETGIGVPDPAELARIHKAEAELRREAGEDENIIESNQDDNFVPFGLGNLAPAVSSITKLVEKTGTKVINRGIGTLETIGKKTYEVLQENDPQLKKKRALLKMLEGEKPVLSSILREAKERAESENTEREKRHFAKKANYETMFDDYTGLVHLEALEMLSKQCVYKLEVTLRQSHDVTEMQETMDQIKDLCELNVDDEEEEQDFDELKSRMTTAINEINIGISCESVLNAYEEVSGWIETTSSTNPDEIHSNAIENLAKITALAVEQYHKAAELLLVKEHRSTADEADSLVQLTITISALISLLSTKYTEKLKNLVSNASSEEIKALISNIYLEAANSSRYVEDAFGLLIPVIQVGAV